LSSSAEKTPVSDWNGNRKTYRIICVGHSASWGGGFMKTEDGKLLSQLVKAAAVI